MCLALRLQRIERDCVHVSKIQLLSQGHEIVLYMQVFAAHELSICRSFSCI